MLIGLMFYSQKQNNIKIDCTLLPKWLQSKLLFTKNDEYVYQNVLNRRKKVKPKLPNHNLVRTADLRICLIQPIGLINCIKILRQLILQERVFPLA